MSDENCYIVTRKMVQFVLIAWEAITVGVTVGKVGAVASYQKCFGEMIFSMKLRTNVVDMLSTSSLEITSESSQHQTTGDSTERREATVQWRGEGEGGNIIIILSVNN